MMRAVGGPDLAEDRAGAGHDVGDAEAVADLDEFAAGDDDLPAGREFVQREEDGGGVVVDGDARRTQQSLEEAVEVNVALAALAGGEVVLEIGISGEKLAGTERGASEIGVEDDAGGIDDAAERRPFEVGEGALDAAFDGIGGGPSGGDVGAHRVERAADLGDDDRVRIAFEGRGEAIEDFVDRRQVGQFQRHPARI